MVNIFQGEWSDFTARNVVKLCISVQVGEITQVSLIIGSKDTVASHKKFEEKYGLPFTLLSDTEIEVIKAYDVWKEKKMYGKTSMGVVRSTYLIDENRNRNSK